ncbi:MAG: shikimate dehydrogenase [Pseudomonadota bacterium]
MYKFTVIGDPISHSLSPLIHQQFAKQTGVFVEYEKRLVKNERIHFFCDDFAREGGHGFNVTLPHKETIVAYLDTISERAQDAGAVNVVKRVGSAWHGDNVDGLGFIQDVKKKGHHLEDSSVIVLGAGGAAKGVIHALKNHRIGRLVIANRTLAKAENLANVLRESHRELSVKAVALEQLDTVDSPDWVISGLSESPSTTLLETIHWKDKTKVYDLNYGSRSQALIDWCRRHHQPVYDGLGMLIEQAAASFELWTGKVPQTSGLDWKKLLGVETPY